MFNSAVLDVAIGMVFVFLLVSFGVTSGNELLSSALKWRATNLAAGIRRLLGDPGGTKLSRSLYQHALIRGLHRDDEGDDDKRKPSHIPARLFAMALLDLALRPAGDGARVVADLADARAAIERNKDALGERVTGALLALADHAATDTRTVGAYVEKLQDGIEHWFDGAMERCGGWYKRKTQVSSVLVALVLCVFVNVDSIRIARVLANNPVLRASLIAEAQRTSAAGVTLGTSTSTLGTSTLGTSTLPTTNTSTPPWAATAPHPAVAAKADARDDAAPYERLQADLVRVNDLGIPMGWGSELSIPSPGARGGPGWWFYKLFGIALTAMAASLGAPFWFDLLQKLLGLREAVKPPASKVSATRDA